MGFISLLHFAVEYFLIVWRASVFIFGETDKSTPKVDLSLRFALLLVLLCLVINWRSVFLHQATKFGKIGVNII